MSCPMCVCFGKGLSEEGLGFMVVKRSGEDDKGDNQRIDWVDNHIAIERKKDMGKFALVLHVATATVERCFSKVKLIKTDLRNRMGDDYFNGALTCDMEKEELINVKNEGNYVRKFLRALHPKWRARVIAIKESKDLSSLALDELISSLKVHEVIIEKDSKIYKGKKERVKSIALKAKKESSDDETSTSGSDDEEYVMAVKNFKKFFRRKGRFVRKSQEERKSFRQRDDKKGKRKYFRRGDPNHLIGECPKPPWNKEKKAFVGGSWSDSENESEDKTHEETCLMAQSSNKIEVSIVVGIGKDLNIEVMGMVKRFRHEAQGNGGFEIEDEHAYLNMDLVL
ncbi:hypothetical protein Tco_0484745 [Tanacetum coccineum]